MPKVEEFYPIYNKDGPPRGAHAAQALALRERDLNFRHFSSFFSITNNE
jgi:hypothetical protein